MGRRVASWVAFGLVSLTASWAPAQTRTRWEMNVGAGVVRFPSRAADHGDPTEYAFARIPALDGPGWAPAPDPDRVGFDVRSSLCDLSLACLDGAEFTYFRSTICVPDPRDLRTLTVRIGDVDDGARVTVFNSASPMGFTPANGFAFLGGGAIVSGDFATRLRVGEPNTLVITHLDDCCSESFLRDVTVLANGRPLAATAPRELCNGLDDDCNGAVDEGLGSTSCGVGACRVTVDNCVGAAAQTCRPGEPRAEVCNGIDDDCDGARDESLGATTCGVGACRVTVPNCDLGVPVICFPAPARAELCNGVDDDCDGVVDNGPVECDAGAAPDVADAPDAAPPADACADYRCNPDLRLEGRAGPLGGCGCATQGAAREGSLATLLLLGVMVGARRRSAQLRQATPRVPAR